MSRKRVRHRARRPVAPVVVAAFVTGVGLAWGLGQLGPDPEGSAQPDVSSTPARSTASRDDPSSPTAEPTSASPVTPARRSGVAAEAPVRVQLPSGTTVPVRAVTTSADGVLDVPDDIRTAGWWRGGSRLGDPFGATLIAAHIDSRSQGLGPYVELLSVRAGAKIVVDSKRLEQIFNVTSLRLVPRNSLAGKTGLFSVSGPRRLVMVTCAGPFDASRGGYQNLAVVTARPDGGPSRRAG